MMKHYYKRRNFLKTMAAVPALTATGIMLHAPQVHAQDSIQRTGGSKLKISLNAYSFNAPLMDGSMKLEELLEYCALHDFDAADLTAYYFPGYPQVPDDEYLYHLKRKAFLLGLDISGTGVRNDFTDPDEGKRKEDITLIKNWIECAAKIGAPVIRIFAGRQNPPGYTWDQIAAWMVKDIRVCVDYGKQHGVIVAIQNHNEFIKTADQALRIIKMVDSDWFGLVLDVGSYGLGDPYEEIEKTAPYAVNWQIKEKILIDGETQKTDLKKLMGIIKSSGYRGYLPIETLGPGDPKTKVTQFLEEVRNALG